MQDKLNSETNFSDASSPLLESTRKAAVYVHVPFCARTCAYCKFYKKFPTPADIESYLQAISQEVRQFLASRGDFEVQSIFFGGGTPTCLSAAHLQKLCANFKDIAGKVEWTVEAAPGTINIDKLKVLRDCGVNRLSLGVQSFDENTLAMLGRPHPLKTALNALDCAAGVFKNLNLDLIFGSAKQTLAQWQSDLQRALQYPITHLSAYCLEFESATSCCAGNLKDYDQQVQEVDFLFETIRTMESRGFKHYEISNYAKPNFECAHNINTWQMNSWVGFGPAAASQIDRRRRRNPTDLKKWLKIVENNSKDYEDIVDLDQEEMLSCALIFGLRMTDGVDLEALKKRYPQTPPSIYKNEIETLLSEGLCEIKNKRLRLTNKGLPLADSVALYFTNAR